MLRHVPALLAALSLAACTAVEPSPHPPTPPPTPTAAASPTVEPEPPISTPAPTPTAAPSPEASVGGFDPQRVAIDVVPFAAGLSALTYLTHAGNGSGRLYALEQEGRIRLIEADGTVHAQPFLDITDHVSSGGERGLLGLAFHPGYDANGRFFVDYTDLDGNTVVAEYRRANDDSADLASERVLLHIEQPFRNHNGGMLAFGPDGYLYISTGDGGGGGDPAGHGQNTSTLLGKLLRIDVDTGDPYALPPDNPFVGRADARPEIWAYGLRNPWRFSFDDATGALFIGDVGQNEWEEIDVAPAGEGGRNYGWNLMEGPDCYRSAECDTAGLIMPVAWYPTRSPDCAVTGGYVYRSGDSALDGAYLFSDYCGGSVWSIDAGAALGAGEVEIHKLADSGINVASFGRDQSGELYLVGGDGTILRITAEAR